MSHTANTTLHNASGGINSGMASSIELVAPAVVMIMFILVFAAIISSAHRYKWLLNRFTAVKQSLIYATKGLLTALVLALIGAPVYAWTQLDSGTKGLALQAIGIVIAGYISLAVLGYIGDRVWSMIVRRHREATGHAPFEGWFEESD